MRSFTAGENDAGVRLSRFVLRVTRGLPESRLHRAFRNRRVKVNGKRAAADYRLAAGDEIELYLNDEFFGAVVAPVIPTDKPLPDISICWEDEAIAILYKPAGVLSHRDERGRPGLLDAFIKRQIERGEYDPAAENTFAPALCNRLDRGTEGLLIAAKGYAALREMNGIIKNGQLEKTYRCITLGAPPPGLHEGWLVRDRAAKQVAVSGGPEDGQAKPIATGVDIIEEAKGLALCEVALLTGRTHQIRAHLAALGAPVLGDMKYGDAAANRRHGVRGQALCAFRLAFGGLPPESGLAHLSGRSFEASRPALANLWDRLKEG